ncbi:hypothetical protein TeGR_g9550 [Tetraparma gracilis]|uniref:Major facilitator superfamily (MFS) profile domain-containing protein n=1 Tax=Tetraparma gracilis TaxID=2962635 RepID=A0ABQ6MVH0_9STRA|nr:hypothetical protein TeGR_g9550 [Tetraparma gracilis]
MSGCKALLLCADDEFLSSEDSSEEQVCVKCDNLTSIAMVVGSFLTFVAITYYVSDKVTIKSTMVQIKGMTTYFQCAQLTTLVDIPWPRIALVLPFAIPFGDGACLTNQVGWTQQHSFFVYIYGALLVAFVIRMRGNRFGKGSIERKETYERLVLFVLICYSPLVQNAATMQRCITDPDFGLVLEADPRVSCETSFLRVTVIIHALAIVAIVGIGLPYFVLRTTYNLRQADRLSESNIYVGLYEWYSPTRPYWEAVLLAKKFVLIMASTTVITDPLAQALIGTATNLGYMILLETKRPMLMQPSQLLRGKNLFHMMERAASTASLIGSIIAVLGAASPGLVGVLGVLFAFCNLIYATYVVGFFFFEEKKIKNRTKVVPDEEDLFKMSAWDSHVKLIDELDLVPADREQMVGEMKLLRTKVLVAIEKELGAATSEAGGAMAQADATLAKLKADTTRIEGDAAELLGLQEAMYKRVREAMYKKELIKLVKVYAGTFQPIETITKLKIPLDVMKLEEGLGQGCTALVAVELHDGVTEIGDSAFGNCSSLAEINVPASVTKLGEKVFEGCTQLRAVELHDGVVEIGDSAFGNCRSLSEIKDAFRYCSSLAEMRIPPSVTELAAGMFSGCTALRVVELHDGVTIIGGNVFENCSSLTEEKAEAEGYSSVNEYVVERAMPENWVMRKGSRVGGSAEQSVSVAVEKGGENWVTRKRSRGGSSAKQPVSVADEKATSEGRENWATRKGSRVGGSAKRLASIAGEMGEGEWAIEFMQNFLEQKTTTMMEQVEKQQIASGGGPLTPDQKAQPGPDDEDPVLESASLLSSTSSPPISPDALVSLAWPESSRASPRTLISGVLLQNTPPHQRQLLLRNFAVKMLSVLSTWTPLFTHEAYEPPDCSISSITYPPTAFPPPPTSTIAYDFGLFCASSSKLSLLNSAFFVGTFAGSLICGPLADQFGRKPVILFFLLLNATSLLLSSLTASPISYAFLRFLAGTSSLALTLANFTLAVEWVPEGWRACLSGLLFSGTACGELLFVLLAALLAGIVPSLSWRALVFVMAVLSFVPAYTSWSADESPKWLGSRGRAAEADALLAKASAAAGIPAPPAFPPPPPPSPQEKPATLGSVLRLSQTWAMALLWFAASANYYGISLAASSLSRGGNVYLTAALSAAMEIPAALLSNYVLEIPWMGRRLSTTALYASGGFMCLLIPVAPPFLTRYLAIAGKTLVSAAFDNIYVYSNEVFPTRVRVSATGFCSAAARIGSVTASSIVFMDLNALMALFGVLCVAAAVACRTLLPETRDFGGLGKKGGEGGREVEMRARRSLD